jgi:hypothetical protein
MNGFPSLSTLEIFNPFAPGADKSPLVNSLAWWLRGGAFSLLARAQAQCVQSIQRLSVDHMEKNDLGLKFVCKTKT